MANPFSQLTEEQGRDMLDILNQAYIKITMEMDQLAVRRKQINDYSALIREAYEEKISP